jgi:hypothetical protein
MPNTGLSEFRSVLADFQQFGSLALKGVLVAPIADIWVNLGPPPSKAIGLLTSLSQMVAVIWVFQFWSIGNERALRVRMRVALVVFFVGLVSSLVLLDLYSVSPGQGRERVIEGYALRSDIEPLISSSYTPDQALRESEYDSDKVWTKRSVIVLRTAITAIWMCTFGSFAVYLTTFVILQRRKHPVHP